MPPLPEPSLIAQLYADAIARGDSLGTVVRVDVAASRRGSHVWLGVGIHMDSPMPSDIAGRRLESSVGPCDVAEREWSVAGWGVREVLYFTAEPELQCRAAGRAA